MTNTRIDLVRALVEFSRPLDAIEPLLREFDWDYAGNAVELHRSHVVEVLNRYLNRELIASDVERWANLLEGRDDVSFEETSAALIQESLHELANPDLTFALSQPRAKSFIDKLS